MTHARAFSRPLRPLFPPRPRPRVSASSSSPHPVLASVHARVAHALAPRVHVPRHACVAHPSTSTANAPTSTSSSRVVVVVPVVASRGASRVVAARAAHAHAAHASATTVATRAFVAVAVGARASPRARMRAALCRASRHIVARDGAPWRPRAASCSGARESRSSRARD
jgi:hypothetical protein